MIADKERMLLNVLATMEYAAVAFSGGVDSSLLLAASVEALGPDRVLALTADSPLLPREELATARQIAAHHPLSSQTAQECTEADPSAGT